MSLDTYLTDFPRQAPTAAESIQRVLRQAILEGALEGGTVLRQEDLAKKFGVSRVPLREALFRLEGEGLVETHPRRGVVVTTLTAEDFEEILAMRFSLESLAIDFAAPRFTDEDARGAAAILEKAEEGMHAKAGPDLKKEFEARWGDLNWEFHRRLYQPAGRKRLLTSIENLHQLFARHLRLRISAEGASNDPAYAGSPEEQQAANLREWAAVLVEHREMLDACKRHDAEAAKAVLKRHISDNGAELVRRLRIAAA